MTQNKVISDAVFKRFDGFRVCSIQRNVGGLIGYEVEVALERNGVDVIVRGQAVDVSNLISLQPSKYWDGGHDPVIGQEFRSKNTDRAYTVQFPVYRDGILTGCYCYLTDEKTSMFLDVTNMMPGREPLTEGQQKAIDDVLYMHKSKWITPEQSDAMIAIIKKSTKS